MAKVIPMREWPLFHLNNRLERGNAQMENATWVGFVTVALVLLNILNLYNSASTAKRNAREPLQKLDDRVKEIEAHVTKMDYAMNELKRDVDKAHEKIRETEANTAAQNKALLAILIWIKSNSAGETDTRQIDDAIKAIS